MSNSLLLKVEIKPIDKTMKELSPSVFSRLSHVLSVYTPHSYEENKDWGMYVGIEKEWAPTLFNEDLAPEDLVALVFKIVHDYDTGLTQEQEDGLTEETLEEDEGLINPRPFSEEALLRKIINDHLKSQAYPLLLIKVKTQKKEGQKFQVRQVNIQKPDMTLKSWANQGLAVFDYHRYQASVLPSTQKKPGFELGRF